MASVRIDGGFTPGDKIEVFPVVALSPAGRPVKRVEVRADGGVRVAGLAPGDYFLVAPDRRVSVTVRDEDGRTSDAPPARLTDEQVRAELAPTRPPEPAGEIVRGTRSTASRPRRAGARAAARSGPARARRARRPARAK